MITEEQKPKFQLTIFCYENKVSMDIITIQEKVNYIEILGLLERAKYAIVLEEKKITGEYNKEIVDEIIH